MWRTLFLGLGVYACLLGVECLLIDKAVLNSRREPLGGIAAGLNPLVGRNKEIQPADWAPWSLLSAGAVTILYSFTIPQRGGEKK